MDKFYLGPKLDYLSLLTSESIVVRVKSEKLFSYSEDPRPPIVPCFFGLLVRVFGFSIDV